MKENKQSSFLNKDQESQKTVDRIQAQAQLELWKFIFVLLLEWMDENNFVTFFQIFKLEKGNLANKEGD